MIEGCPLLKNFLEKLGPYISDNAQKYQNGDVQKEDFQYVERCPYAHRYAPPVELRKSEVYRSTQKRFLNEAIKTKGKRLNNLEKQKKVLENQLKASVSYLDFTHMHNLIEKNNYKKITRVKAVHTKKLGNIGYSEIEELAPDKVIFNFSSRSLTVAEKSLLCKGLKFAIPPRKFSIEHHLYTFEKLFEA